MKPQSVQGPSATAQVMRTQSKLQETLSDIHETHVLHIKSTRNEFSKLQSSSLSLIHDKKQNWFYVLQTGIYKEIIQLFMEKNKLQPKTCSRQAHKILFLSCWRHKSKMMAIGFGCIDGYWSLWVQEVFFRSHHCEMCTKQSPICLWYLHLTYSLTRDLYHLPCQPG